MVHAHSHPRTSQTTTTPTLPNCSMSIHCISKEGHETSESTRELCSAKNGVCECPVSGDDSDTAHRPCMMTWDYIYYISDMSHIMYVYVRGALCTCI